MDAGLWIAYRWHDIDVLEVKIKASNGEFSGLAQAYINHDDPRKAAEILEGFPRTSSDTRTLSFGTMDPEFAGGGALLRFFCTDGSGHAAIEVQMMGGAEPMLNRWSRPPQTAHFFANIEANAIDDFVRELRAFDPRKKGFASLLFVEP